MNLQKAMKYYLDYLKADTADKLAEVLRLGQDQAQKVLNFVNGVKPSYREKQAIEFCKELESVAVVRGCACCIEAPGKWRLKTEDLLDVLDLCEIRSANDLALKIGVPHVVYQLFAGKKDIAVLSSTVNRLCEVTGSLPEEIAYKILK